MEMRKIESEFGFVDIRTFREFEDTIYNVLEEYITDTGNYDDTDYLVINGKTLDVAIENINKIGTGDEKFELSKLVRHDESGALEVDVDAESEVAGKFLFVR